MEELTPGWRTWRHGAGLAICVLIGWVALVRGQPVPVLVLVNLGFHELGHLVTYPFPDLFTALMGSVAQVAVPAGLALYFGWARRDLLGTGLCLAWSGAAAQEVGVYVADAPHQRLQLIGGEHDWAFILRRLHALDAADETGAVVLAAAWVLVFAGSAVCAWALVSSRRPRTPLAEPVPSVTARSISWNG
jgi:hypothetical protein